MRKKFLLAALAAAMTLLLSGCFVKTVDELYALPKHSDEYYDLQKAIDEVMRGPEKQSIVVRGPEGIVTKVEELKLTKDKKPWLGWPLIRGVVNFGDSMVAGVKALMYGEGISRWGEILDLGVQLELIQKSGSWFSINDERIGQGRDNAKQYLVEHPDVADRIEQEIRDNMWKLQGDKAKPPIAPASKPVDVSADDFSDEN